LHDYIKFLKYGYSKVTDHASREIRLKRMTREEGIGMVKRYQDTVPADMPLFLDWIGMTEDEFYACIDPWRSPSVWRKNGRGEWGLLDSVINHIDDLGVDEARIEKIEDCEFIVTTSREPNLGEDRYLLMGRGYIDKYNYGAIEDRHE
jgi:hypothetical protein